GFAVGTPSYMAPEQVMGAELDGRADQYAWGLTAHALLVGANPRHGDRTLVRPIPGLVAPGVSRNVSRIIARATAFERDDRFPTMEDVATALEKTLEKTSSPRVHD